MRISDWSSDVCSSDLPGSPAQACRRRAAARLRPASGRLCRDRDRTTGQCARLGRAEARRDSTSNDARHPHDADRSEEHTSEPQSLMRNSYAVFCLKKKKTHEYINNTMIATRNITTSNKIN